MVAFCELGVGAKDRCDENRVSRIANLAPGHRARRKFSTGY
jgi:hypothetical protein